MLASAQEEPRPSGPAPSSTARLPASFDRDRDAIVLVGDSFGARALELRSAGVLRVLALTKTAQPSVEGVRAAQTTSETLARLVEFDPPPDNVVVERIAGSSFTDQELRDFAAAVRDRAMNSATIAVAGATWIKHCLTNLPELARAEGLEAFAGRFRGTPAIVVSPGPSLQKNIDKLQGASDKALIIAGNRALLPLRKAGIVPHIVVVADALNLRYQLDDGLLDGVALLALDVVCHSEVVSLPAARKVFFASNPETFRSGLSVVSERGLLRSGGSVATLAYSLAAFVGCEQIALVGQDLALAGSSYYVESAPDGSTKIQIDETGRGIFKNSSEALRRAMAENRAVAGLGENAVQDFYEVPGYDGGAVRTSRQFDTYRTWFSSEAQRLAPQVLTVNCTEGGARIDGVQQRALSEFLSEFAADAGVSERLPAVDPPSQKRRKKEILGFVEGLQKTLLQTEVELNKCERLRKQASQSPDALARLDLAEKQLNSVVSKVPFVVALESAEVDAARRQGANAKTLEESLDATGRLYRTIERAIITARPLLARARKELKT